MSALLENQMQVVGPNGIPVENWYETQIKVHKVEYVWLIRNYQFHKGNMKDGEKLKSSLFWNTSYDKCKWYLELDPKTRPGDSILYLYLDSTSDCKKVSAKCKLSLMDENQKELLVLSEGKWVERFETGIKHWNLSKFISNFAIISDLNDTLRIYCEITFPEVDPVTITFIQSNSIIPTLGVPELHVVEDIKQLFKNEELTDIVVSAKGKNFKAHKAILSARSPVFAAMFKHENMIENQQNTVDIPDFDGEVVGEMLNFIYTGKSENLETLAADLLAIADKYGLDRLKDISGNALVENLSVETVIDVLLLADLHRACSLKTYVINFIVAKSGEVMKTTAWKNIALTHPKLLLEVCEAFPRIKNP